MKQVAVCYQQKFSPSARANQLTGPQVQQHLRIAFETWGLPKALRVDNGDPWATRSDVPSALALWLIGLGIKVLLNRPHQSTDNGIVERGHGVLAKWVEAHKASDVPGLQRQVDWAVTMQRERYPSCQGQSRLVAYPELYQTARPYRIADEAQLWQFERVQRYLSQFIWRRRVDKVGYISLFSSSYSVGRAYSQQDVYVHLEIATHEWVIESEQGDFLKRFICKEVTPERIFAFDLAKRSNKAS